ncbi:MAG: bacteriophytochrome heme oxygenase BphO [Myxococcales bacterium]|nr:bacteriophytochrome heme oxygenase BphO [Myxococcales bacterium]
MQQTSWMLVRLSTETRIHHAGADGDRLAMMERPSDRSYRSFLERVYCFEAPLEAAFALTRRFDRGLVGTHMKTKRLATDLDALGVDVAALDIASSDGPVHRTAFDDVAEALGWMYVVQRNILLHGLLSRHLATRIPEAMRRAGSYLTAHDSPGMRFRELGSILDHAAHRTYIADRIVRSASEAFRCQRQWYACVATRVIHARPAPDPIHAD